jgi:hypothetical protein
MAGGLSERAPMPGKGSVPKAQNQTAGEKARGLVLVEI